MSNTRDVLSSDSRFWYALVGTKIGAEVLRFLDAASGLLCFSLAAFLAHRDFNGSWLLHDLAKKTPRVDRLLMPYP